MNKLPKIAIVVGTFPVVSQTFIVNQINALIDEGFDVNLYAFKKGEISSLHNAIHKHHLINEVTYFKKLNSNYLFRFLEFLFWTLKNCFKIKWLQFFKTLNVFKYGKEALSLRLFYGSYWLLIQDKFDVIQVHFAHNAYMVSNLKSLGIIPNSTKIITTIHGYDLIPSKFDYYKKVYQNILKESAVFTVNSDYTKTQLLKLEPNLNNVKVLPVGLDTSFFSKSKHLTIKDTFDILFCGRLIELKGPEIAIKVVEILIQRGYKNLRLHIVGDGPLLNHLKTEITTRDLLDYIHIKGMQNQEAIVSLLENTNVLIMPGIRDPKTGQEEAQGLVIQEAQSMEVPVVVSDVGGMKYGLLPEKSGFVVETNNVNAFADGIEKLISNKTLAQSMGKEGRDFVIKNYDSRVLVKQLIEIYKTLGVLN